MKVWVAHEELWVLKLGGSHDDGLYVDLPDEVAERCKRAEKESEACLQLLSEAYDKARASGVKTRFEKWREKHARVSVPTGPTID